MTVSGSITQHHQTSGCKFDQKMGLGDPLIQNNASNWLRKWQHNRRLEEEIEFLNDQMLHRSSREIRKVRD